MRAFKSLDLKALLVRSILVKKIVANSTEIAVILTGSIPRLFVLDIPPFGL
jgi:hypothetical protein